MLARHVAGSLILLFPAAALAASNAVPTLAGASADRKSAVAV